MRRCRRCPCRVGGLLRRQYGVDVHVDAVVVDDSVVYSKDVAAGQIQLAAVEAPVVDIHQCDDHAVTDLPEVEDGVAQIGDRIAKRLGCRKKFRLGVSRVAVSETEVHVRRRECGNGVLVCSVDGADQCPNQVAGCRSCGVHMISLCVFGCTTYQFGAISAFMIRAARKSSKAARVSGSGVTTLVRSSTARRPVASRSMTLSNSSV